MLLELVSSDWLVQSIFVGAVAVATIALIISRRTKDAQRAESAEKEKSRKHELVLWKAKGGAIALRDGN
jgi:hypothetical protein